MPQVDGLSYRFPDAASDALQRRLVAGGGGSVTLVVGPSGGGKTTLLRCLNGLIPHFHGGSFGGDRARAGRRHARLPRRATWRARSAWSFRTREAQFVTEPVEDELAFGLENLGVAPRRMR